MDSGIKISYKYLLSVLLVSLIFLSYSDSFNASWHLDDYPNIVLNNKLHIKNVNLKSIIDTFYASQNDSLYRPIPMFSFAVNWYFHKYDTLGYHFVNIILHCINSLLLFVLIVSLIKIQQNFQRLRESEIYLIGFLASVFWALNPIQTQAVTYIVQRMTAMSAMFYLIALYAYYFYRTSLSDSKRWISGFICFFSYIFSIMSKENAIVLPLSIVLMDYTFFQNQKSFELKWNRLKVVAFVGFIIAIILTCVFDWNGILEKIQTIYDQRSFTIDQRLMTQSRVLIYYISLILLPLPSRLSLCKDIDVSTSLFSPGTTLLSIFLIVSGVTFCLLTFKKYRLANFAVLFFFINHLVESTILPLELYFEHRNYLPSIFLFVPLVTFIVQKKSQIRYKNKKFNTIVIAFLILIVGLWGNWTFQRNMIWMNEKVFWEHEIAKNPALARPYHNLAWSYYQPKGDYLQTIALYKKALTLKSTSKIERARTLNNLGRVYYLKGEYENALSSFEFALEQYPNMPTATHQKVMTLIQLERWQQALELIDHLIKFNYRYGDMAQLKGIVLMHQGDMMTAAKYFESSLRADPASMNSRVNLSIALARLKFYDRASDILENADTVKRGYGLRMIGLAEISRLKGDSTNMQRYLQAFTSGKDCADGIRTLEKWSNDKLLPMIDFTYYSNLICTIETSNFHN